FMRWAGGCFIYCRREAFEVVGGFDEDYYASEEIWMSQALKRQGRFVILKEHVISSGRKARQYPFLELAPIVMKLLVKGPEGTKKRDGLGIWYESRREASLPEQEESGSLASKETSESAST
ncbi:MAG: hypothetical protein O7G85_13260, partial [Planctomycetota bacterium]|nr:hypothetical protein [Planctomycetota bacterium]